MVEKSVFWQKMCIEGKFDLFSKYFFGKDKTVYTM